MSCPFALLGLPRRPLLSDEEIGTAYRKLARTLHPDQAEGDAERFKELGEAVTILRDPSRRLKEICGSKTTNRLPPQAAEFFPQVAALLQRSDDLISRHHAASNALAKALLATPLKTLAQELKSTISKIQRWQERLDQELVQIDQLWPECDAQALALLADGFAYAASWRTQLRERELVLDAILS